MRSSSRVWCLFGWMLAVVAGAGPALDPAQALPVGRSWAPYARMQLAGTSFELGMPLLDRDSSGTPYFVVDMQWDTASARNLNIFNWRDTAWQCVYVSPLPSGFPVTFVARPDPPRSLAWLTYDPTELYLWAVISEMRPDSIARPDTAFRTVAESTEYGAAAWGRRRWVLRADNTDSVYVNHIRVAYSDTARSWHEVAHLGVNEDHCTIAPLGDTTAMVVYAGQSGLQYAVLEGSRWVETGNLDPRPFNAAHPELRLRHSGGLWLFWADNDWMHMSTYRNGAWERGDSLRCSGGPGETFSPTFLDVEQDTTEYPAFAWTNSGYGQTWRDVTAIAFPNSHGWDAGEEIADSELSGWVAPSLTHDVNDDLWLVWRRASEGINRWTHTYCSATCPAPTVVAQGQGTRVAWALSSHAPGSRWTLFRAQGAGAFDSLATVRAGADSLLAFDDANALPGSTWRYLVRRECLDVRYLWASDTTEFSRADDCAVTCAAPSVTALGAGTRVAWSLPAGAPDTRWTLLRAREDGAFDSLATFAAGADTAFAFDDSTALAGVTWRYAVRRGCAYAHEVWTSATTSWWRADARAPLTVVLANPTGAPLALQVGGATGRVRARLFDLQGRLVLDQQFTASETGRDAWSMDLGGSGASRSGVYFLRVQDATGRTAPTARVVVVR
jgi:hypothetical protein